MDGLVIKILLGGLILAILLFEAAFSPRRRGRSMGHFSLFGTLLIVAVALGRWGSAAATGSWHGMAGDLFSAYFDVLFLAGACLVLLISISSSSDVNSGERRSQTVAAGSESHALALAATLGMMVTAAADDLLLLFLGLELTSISMQILSTSVRPSRLASEAGIKLTLTASAASGFFLMGLALLYGATGTTSLTGLSEHLQADAANQTLALSGMGLLLVGLGLRIGVVPFHLWLPDVVQGAATPVSALLCSGAVAAALAAAMRLLADGLSPLASHWIPLVWGAAAATMTAGNLLAIGQRQLKRALAYAGVAQFGFALVGLAAASEGGLGATSFYLVVHAVISLGCYAVVSQCHRDQEAFTEVEDYSGLGRRHPLLGLGLTVLLLGLAGLPPTAGFPARFWLAESAIEAGFPILAVAVVVNTALSAYVYLRIAIRVFAAAPPKTGSVPVVLSPHTTAVLMLAVLAALGVGLWPGPLMELAREAAQSFL